MNYLITAACLSFFTGKHLDLSETLKSGGYQGHVGHIDANEFANRIDSILGMYVPDVTRVQLNLLDSHDTPRFLTCAGRDLNSLKLALMFIFTYPGTPCLFYGDEIGLYGRHDPECRQPFPWGESKWNHDLRDFIKGLIALRKAHPVLRGDGSFKKLYAADGIYVFQRSLESETLFIALNASEAAHKVEVKADTSSLGKKQILFGQADVETDKETIRLNLPARSGVVVK
jgi:glycosidase